MTDLDKLSIPELRDLLATTQAALNSRINARKAELEAELAELNGKPVKAVRVAMPAADARAEVKPNYRTPDGLVSWSGRGGIPKAFKALGVTDKVGMEAYRI
jgi:DNA-binding protein H-NS